MFIFPAGPEGYSSLYETNGCRLDARGLWAFFIGGANKSALANEPVPRFVCLFISHVCAPLSAHSDAQRGHFSPGRVVMDVDLFDN